jgi:hypothetical protein
VASLRSFDVCAGKMGDVDSGGEEDVVDGVGGGDSDGDSAGGGV